MAAVLKQSAAREAEAVGEDERYAIYTRNIDGKHTRLAETSMQGIGLCLVTLHNEGQITKDDPIGVLDQVTRSWIVNPWARGARP